MDTQKILPRSEVPEELTWDLRDIFPSDEAWRAEYDALAAVPEEIAAFRGTLGRSAEDLLAWMRLQDALSIRLTKLLGYASCKGDEDTGNSFYQDMRSKATSRYVAIASAAAFATPELMAIPEDTLQLFYAASRSWRRTAACSSSCAAARRTSSPRSAKSCSPPPVRWPTRRTRSAVSSATRI